MEQNYLREKPKPKQSYALHCDCGFHRVTDGTDFKLVEIKQAPIPRGIPTLEDGKIKTPDPEERPKKFKCPKCGRGVTARKSNVKVIPHLVEKKDDEKKSKPTGREVSTFGRAVSPDFTG